MVEAGRVYAAVPPLYGIKTGTKKVALKNGKHTTKNTYEYFTTKLDYVKFRQKQFGKTNVIQHHNGNKLSSKESIELLFNNIDYMYELHQVADHYAIDPHLLELVLYLKGTNVSPAVFKKTIIKAFPFLSFEKSGDTTIIKGLIGTQVQRMFVNDVILAKCGEIFKLMFEVNRGNINYLLNGAPATIYDIMNLYETTAPDNITRFKGLGEMNPEQLGESTLHPDSDRTLLRYTVEDIKEEIEMIRYLQSNKAELIKNLNVTRRQLLELI